MAAYRKRGDGKKRFESLLGSDTNVANVAPGRCWSLSFARHCRSLFADLCRVEDVLEGVGVLILLHQLLIDELLRLGDGISAAETRCRPTQKRGGKFVFAIRGNLVDSVHHLLL